MTDNLLRQRAQAQWEKLTRTTQDLERDLTPEAVRAMVHELQVHQIELEMQNEELQQSQLSLELTKARYFDLYELAPVGYLTVSEAGLIVECNLAASRMLGVLRREVTKRAFSRFIAKEDQDAWYLLRKKVAATHEQINAEMRLVRDDGPLLWCMVSASHARDELGVVTTRVTITDITERKQIDNALQASNAQLQLLGTCVSRLNDIVLITEAEPFDEPGPRIVFVNDAFVRRTGYSREEVIGRTPRILQGAKTQRSELERIGAALRRWEPVRAELINYTKAGQEFWLELDIVPVADEKGWYTHWVAVERDITERKQTAETLRQTQALLANAEKIGRVGGWEIDVQTLQTTWTEAVYDIYELDSTDRLTVDEGINYYTPESRPMIELAVQRAIEQGEPFDLELEIISAKGNLRNVHAVGKADRARGKVSGFFQDITERKRNEYALRASNQLYEAVALATNDAIWDRNLTRNTTVWNAGYQTLFGYAPEATEPNPKSWTDFIHPEDADRVLSGFQQMIDGGGRIWSDEYRFRRVDGSYADIFDRGYILHDEQGRATRIIGAMQDVTARKQAQRELQALLKEKTALLQEVHHRVKNNLQVITSLLRMESRRSKEDGTKAVLGDMQARISAMALLHESLYRTGTFASVDLGSYLRQLSTQSFRAQSTISGAVRLELDLGSVQVSMDQAIPCGLLINELISNCFKHGFPAGVTGQVRIELQPLDTANQWRLRVCDTGVGLPDNFEEKRSNSLGLQLVGDLSRQIGGELTITPNQDKGVSFTVNFQALEPAALVMPA